MFLITIPSAKEKALRKIAAVTEAEVHSPTSLSVEKPSVVGEIARYLCKVGKCFEVQPWE